jgi:thiol-disulfide isomerase/thioredoxin
MMKKLALALMLALPLAAFASHAEGSAALPLTIGRLTFDGVNRRAPARRPVRRKARRRSGARHKMRAAGSRAGVANGRAPVAVRPVVTEIDGVGLKNLLQRGEAATARPLLINFWATWCTPCREEFPDLVKIDLEYRERGLEFVVISADDVSELKTGVPKFLRRMRARMPAYLLNTTQTEADMAQIDPAWAGELPATFLFDRQGKLVFKHTGIIDAAQLRAELEKVLRVTGDQ